MSSPHRRILTLASHLSPPPPPSPSHDDAPPRAIRKNLTASSASTSDDDDVSHLEVITRERILAERENGKVLLVLKNKVYDVTDFLPDHPGGDDLITDIAPDDFKTMNREFDEADHSEEAMEQLEPMLVGVLASEDQEEEEEDDHPHLKERGDPYLPFEKHTEVKLPLLEVYKISRDVSVFRFGLEAGSHTFRLPIGKHVVMSFEGKTENVGRAYTPVSPLGDVGFFDVLVKLYPNGKMSQHLAGMKVGDMIRFKGPKGKLEYAGKGNFKIRRKGKDVVESYKHVAMLAGGSGITPMFQIMQQIANDPEDNTKLTLLFANKSYDDIILKPVLDAMARAKAPGQITIHYVLDKFDEATRGSAPPGFQPAATGFVNPDMIRKLMPGPKEAPLVLLCGPPPMVKNACIPALKQLGWSGDAVFKF